MTNATKTTKRMVKRIQEAEMRMHMAARSLQSAIDAAAIAHMRGSDADYRAARDTVETARAKHDECVRAWLAATERP